MINKLKERRKSKTTNVKEYRRFNNQLKRGTGRAKEVYIEEIWWNNGSSEKMKLWSHVSECTTIKSKN